MASSYFPAQEKVSPNYTEPGLIRTYAQPSGAFEACLPGGALAVRIGDDDLFVYVNSYDIRTNAQAAQSAGNFLPSMSLRASFDKTATYLLRNRCVYNHHDVSAAAHYALGLPEELETTQRQGIFMMERDMLLYGMNPDNNEGLLNASGATAVTLPPDSYGNSTLATYDPNQLAIFFLNQIVALQAGMWQGGQRLKVHLLGPQRILLAMAESGVVQLTSFQRDGAGSQTVSGMIQTIAERNSMGFEWFYDDTLIGKGAGGTDMVIMTAPEIEPPKIEGLDIAPFNEGKPSLNAINTMYTAFAAPIKIPTPIPDGGITVVLETRSTSGWNWRPQGLYLISIAP